MSALDNFTAILKYLVIFSSLSGASVQQRTSSQSRTTLVSRFWIGCCFGTSLLWLYTVITVPDIASKWRSCAMIPMIMQGLAKFYVHIRHVGTIAAKLGFFERIYRLNPDRRSANYRQLLRWSARILFIIRYGWKLLILVGSMFIATPVWTYLMYGGERTLILEFWIPGVDHRHSTAGYALHFAYHSAMVFLAAVGTCAADLCLLTLTLHLWPMAAIWAHMCDMLDGALAHRKSRHSAERRAYFCAMLRVHRDISAYLSNLSRIYMAMTFCEVYTCSGMLCMLLYCYIVLNWMLAPVFGLSLLIKLVLYCLLGTMVELATDRVYASLLHIDWYRLTCAEQRLLLVVLADAQRPTLLMAGTLPLNMITCVESLKTVYSVGMLLVSSLED